MHYKTTESLLAFIKKKSDGFSGNGRDGEKNLQKTDISFFQSRNTGSYSGREIYRNKKSFGIDCIFDSKEGVSEVSYHCQPQRFSGF